MEQIKMKYKQMLKNLLVKISIDQPVDSTLVVFGVGNTSQLYAKCFQSENIIPDFYADNDVKKQGTIFQGVKVISPAEITTLENPFVLICSGNIYMVDEIKAQLNEMNIPCMYVDEYVFARNIDKFMQVIDLLDDEYSVKTYYHALVARITNCEIDKEFVSEHQYFAIPRFRRISNNEVFVDMGAFVGEGIEEYLFKRSGSFKKIFAFEPDKRNFAAMEHRIKRLTNEWALNDDKIICVRAGIGRENAKLKFISNQTDMGSRGACFSDQLTDDDNDCEMVYCLDEFLKHERVTYLKADIESYELDMLIGAQNIITEQLPLIAVCIYHNATDMFKIPLFLKSLSPKYKFAIRHHHVDTAETVLYAWAD